MDVRMPGIGGIEATRRIVNSEPRTKAVVLTTFDLDEYAFNSLQVGANAFLLKSSNPDELTDAIRAVAAGDSDLAPNAARRLLDARIPSRQS